MYRLATDRIRIRTGGYARIRDLEPRIIVSIFIGLFILTAVVAFPNFTIWPGGDFAYWPVRAARDLISGIDPYSYTIESWEVPYPLTTAILALPFAVIPDHIAGALFFGLSSALMAMALTRGNRPWGLLAFLSVPFIENLYSVQWGPLMVAAAVYPHLLPVTLGKPHIGIVSAMTHKPNKTGLLLSTVLVLLSFIIDPLWVTKWINSVGGYGGRIPILYPLGFVALLSLLKWRDPRAKIILLIAIMPKQSFYDYMLLWLVPNNKVSMVILTLVSWVVFFMGLNAINIYSLFLIVPVMMLFAYAPADQSTSSKFQLFRPL